MHSLLQQVGLSVFLMLSEAVTRACRENMAVFVAGISKWIDCYFQGVLNPLGIQFCLKQSRGRRRRMRSAKSKEGIARVGLFKIRGGLLAPALIANGIRV